MSQTDLSYIRERLKANSLNQEDIRFLDALLAKAEAEGLGEVHAGGKRVVARLPFGMDIVK